jgi:hypothetical protein
MLKVMYWVVLISLARGVQAHHPSHSPAYPNPVIDTVYPDYGRSGDTITITGRGFGLNPNDMQVTIGGVPVEVTRVTVADPGYQTVTVRLNGDVISGLVSLAVGDHLATHTGTFCAQPTIDALAPIFGRDGTFLQIWGSNFGHSTVVFVGETLLRPQRTKSSRRLHRIDADRLLLFVEHGVQGSVSVLNACPDGRSFSDTYAVPVRLVIGT